MESNNKFSKMMKVLFLGMCILLTGCSASQEEKQMDKTEESFVLKEEQESGIESKSSKYQPERSRTGPYNFTEHIEKKHKILTYDICSNPQYDYENTLLKEYLAEDLELNRQLREKLPDNTSLSIDYHIFDFNDDGLEDYVVCLASSEYCGSAGNNVRIYIQESNGKLRRVLDITMRILNANNPNGHEAFTVLDEKTDGYYAIVSIFYNRILRYDKQTEQYEFHEGE